MVWIFDSETKYCFARARELKGFFHSNSLIFHSLNDKFSVSSLIYSQHYTFFGIVIVKNMLTSVYYASVLLLVINFVITLSKFTAEPL